MKIVALTVALALAHALAHAGETTVPPENAIEKITAQRCSANPLITAESSETIGHNINGPSVIKAPEWLKLRLGNYYMYFAHHGGKYIRLAYADALEGPWTVYEPGTLQLEDAESFRSHVASPDVHIDEQNHLIRMYFHGPAKRGGQRAGVAISSDGLNFQPSTEILGKFYFRVWQWDGAWYALAKDGNTGWGELYRSENGLTNFVSGGQFLEKVRHSAVTIRGHHLLIFYSRAGDAPERILAATVDMRPDWREWEPSEPIDVLAPETEYEGIEYPNEPSNYGSAVKVRQLRDPGIYEEDGQVYLFYSIAGEMGIAMAKLDIEMKPEPEKGEQK